MPRRPVVVLNVVGLTPRLLPHMPHTRALAARGFCAALSTVLPAVTCSVQSTLLTGLLPREHGIVGNGWYFRELGEVHLWRQHNRLVAGEKLWDAAKALDPAHQTANICWWYAMGAATEITITPRPIYYADGRKAPDAYTRPTDLHDELLGELGDFPLFSYWGPGASITSSAWIAQATRRVFATRHPDLSLVYLPHLDYDLQRYGPDAPQAARAAAEVDGLVGDLAGFAADRGAAVVVLSEYGITPAARPVDVNRHLRRAGLLEVYTQDGMEYLDPWTSRAFAVADHQVAHVYVRDPADRARVREVLGEVEGIDVLLDDATKHAAGLDHHRAGEFVAVAEPDAWFTYYYWLDDDRAPDFARSVDIHRKPGYDPAELVLDPHDRMVKARAAARLAQKKLGLRYVMDVIGLDPKVVRGTHGRLPDERADGPVLIASDAAFGADAVHATEVKDLVLRLAGLARR